MKRTVAQQLALVNWRGVFYERYLLDPGVTALEGANGAGKTTVMVAAYIVLLPDKRFLHFEPLAEGGVKADDRGIWGRLGTGDAYSAIDFGLGSGERLLAGVRLERRGRDNGELHPFLVRGLPADVPLQSILLERVDDRDEVPAPDRLAHLAAIAGGRLTWCDSAGDYLRELFDAGVAPMPMSLTIEREKLNELLRTSMMGGVSKKLGDGLTSFLLRPEEGLGRNLKRIRANLDDCRRTRMLVNESRQLEEEIHQILEAGMRMFAAAMEGARRMAYERQHQADDAERKRNAARSAYEGLDAEHGEAQLARLRSEERDEATKETLQKTQEWVQQVQRANDIWKKRSEAEARLSLLENAVTEASRAHEAATAMLRTSEDRVRECELDHQEAARGMANIQEGLERLHGRASRFRAVQAALGRARAALPEMEFLDEEAPAVLQRCLTKVSMASRELVDAQGALDTAEEQERAFRTVHRALESIQAQEIDDVDAYAVGLAVLRDLWILDGVAAELGPLRTKKRNADEMADRQADVRRRAISLATPEEPLKSSEQVKTARDGCSEALDREREAWLEAADKQRILERDVATLEARIGELQGLADEYRLLRALVQELGLRWERPADTSAQVGDLSVWLQEQVVVGRQQVEALVSEVSSLERRIQEVRNAGGAFPEHLVDVCSSVDGRLLVERFESVPYEQAAEVEARLGPLVHAVVVEDAREAVRTLVGVEDRPDTVWILDGSRATLDPENLPEGEVHAGAVAASIREGIRSTRIPDAPVVGRQARERLLERLQEELEAKEGLLGDARERARALKDDVARLKPFLTNTALLDREDPALDLGDARARLADLRRALANSSEDVLACVEIMGRLKARKAALEAIWADAGLLDPPDHAAEAARYAERIAKAVEAERHLGKIAADRETLQNGLDVLRSPPPDETAREELARLVSTASERRRFWLVPQADLDAVSADLAALGFADAEEQIRQDETMLASLNEEVETAESLLVKTREERDEAKKDEAAAEAALRDAKGTWDACNKRIGDLQQELDDSDVTDPSDEARAAAEESIERAKAAEVTTAAALRKADQLVAGLAPQVDASHEKLQETEVDLKDKAAQAGPAVERWHGLRARCEELGLLDTALGDPVLEDVAGELSIRVFELRKQWWAVMLERLDRADDGGELAAFLRRLGSDTEAGSEQFLKAWLQTRSWLALRVPKHVSEVDDPVDALRRLRRHLDRLVDKLERHEHLLQGDSRDVARAIEGRLRKVNNLLNKLNRELRGVGFGSIEAIQVKSEREKLMSKILVELSSPDSQQNLYGADQTIEDALDDLFRRHGGRKHGGKRILDYREYLRLLVEVRRRGSDEWEEARGNQMSTGEAIGVGAAIMMVVLTAWERDASLLRPKPETGTLRFLFLDEATRLSLDNLEVLFDLCEALDLQLLIAAPEVATSKGNTTYLLQRGTDAEGREVVHVSGRRAIQSDA